MLNNFDFCVYTNFIFGKDVHERLGKEIRNMNINSVLIHHDNGMYLNNNNFLINIKNDLKDNGIKVYELGGVLSNPRLSLVYDGVKLVKRENITFILAIGGGSVIDSAKAISAGAMYNGDVWDFFSKGKSIEQALPIGVILTNPATGSESGAVSVINNEKLGQKYMAISPLIRPKIVFMNPELTYSLPKFHTACGIVDMFSHVCERYFTPEDEIGMIDRMAEGILKTIVDIGSKVLKQPDCYEYRAEIMWIGTIAHNNTVGVGRTQDWATHEIANELSALYDTPHGVTLSIIMPSWMRYTYKKKPERFARFANQVFDIPWDGQDTEVAAMKGIIATEEFFRSLGMPTSFHEYNIPTNEIDKMLDRILFRGDDNTIGGMVPLNRKDVQAIYEMAF